MARNFSNGPAVSSKRTFGNGPVKPLTVQETAQALATSGRIKAQTPEEFEAPSAVQVAADDARKKMAFQRDMVDLAKSVKNQQLAAQHGGYQYATPSVAPAPVNPVGTAIGNIGKRFVEAPQNTPAMKALASAPAQYAFKQARAGASALGTGVVNTAAGGLTAADMAGDVINKFGVSPARKAEIDAVGQQRRAQLRTDVSGINAQAQKNLGVTDKQTQGLGYQVMASIPQMATLFVPGGQAAFFATAAGNYASDAERRGADASKAVAYGLLGGAAELATEKLLFLVPKGVRSGVTKLLGKTAPFALKATRPVGEAAQEAVIGPIMGLAEKALFNPDKEWVGAGGVVDFNQMKGDALAGALLGTVFIGLASPNAETQQKAQKIVEQAQATGEPDIAAVNDLAAELKKNKTKPSPKMSADGRQFVREKDIPYDLVRAQMEKEFTERLVRFSDVEARISQDPLVPAEVKKQWKDRVADAEKNVSKKISDKDIRKVLSSGVYTAAVNDIMAGVYGPTSEDATPTQTPAPVEAPAPAPEIIGEGMHTGTVEKRGDKVYKSTMNRRGGTTMEAEVYADLTGTEGIAPGKSVALDGQPKIELPYYKKVMSRDVVKKEDAKKYTSGIAANIPRIMKAIQALTNKGYIYADPLQFGVDNGGNLNLMDFSNASKEDKSGYGMDSAFERNMSDLSRFFNYFGLDRQANIIDAAKEYKGFLDIYTVEDIKNGDILMHESDPRFPVINQLKRAGDIKPNNVYYATNAREIQTGGIAQTEPIDGVKYVYSESKLPDSVVDEWELTPLHEQESPGVETNLQQFGTIAPGPTVGVGPTVESKVSQNVAAGRVGNATVTEAFKADPITYQQLTKTQTIEDMNSKMADYDGSTKSLDKIYNSWANRIQEGTGVTTGDIPLVRVLANEYEKMGDSKKAEQAYAIISEAALTYGRYVNAFKYAYDALEPTRVIAGAQKITDKINEEGDKRYGKKWTDLELTKEETDAFAGLKTLKETLTAEANAMPDGVAKQEALDAIPDKIAEEQARIMEGVTDRWAEIVPSTAIEKWNYWRRFAMLTSPKTHVRNVVSNAGRVVMEGVKDSVATGLERITFVPKEQRLHSAGWMFNKPAVQKANELWKTVKSELTHTMKYEVTTLGGLERKVKPLGKAVGVASDFVMNALEKEDEGFMQLAFVSSLAQQMQARGVTEPTQAMIERAKNVSLENTYKLMNSFSEAIMSVKKAGGLPGGALDALLPFTRTPAAVAKTAVEFTPVLGLVQMGRDIKRGRITNRAETIDALSKQIVGSGLLALGYFMAKAGLGFGEDEKSAKAKEIQQLGGGRQPFSVKVGDKTFTIDWMQPTSSPIITGMQLYQTIKKKGLQAVPSSLSSVMTSAIDTFFDQSMLSGVGQLFKADDKGEALLNLGVDYIMQGIPVLYTQIAKAASGPERSTYDPSMSFEQKVATRFVSKLAPWTLPKKSDVLGGEKTQGTVIDIANAVLSPGFIKKQSSDPAAAELYRLYSVRKDEDGTEMLPKVAPAAITDDNGTRKTSDDVKVKLTPEQRIQFTREYGLAVQQEVTKKLSDSRYAKKTDEEKVKAIKDLMSKLYETQKSKMTK